MSDPVVKRRLRRGRCFRDDLIKRMGIVRYLAQFIHKKTFIVKTVQPHCQCKNNKQYYRDNNLSPAKRRAETVKICHNAPIIFYYKSKRMVIVWLFLRAFNTSLKLFLASL